VVALGVVQSGPFGPAEIALDAMDLAWAVVGKVSIIKVETNASAEIKAMMTRGR